MHEEPVEILVRLAERGEIDPWNIDIVEVTDRFLSELERCRELDLAVSGRTLFYAATLLRMKSESLSADAEGEEEGEDVDAGEEEDDFAGSEVGEPIERLEREIQRRIGRKKVRHRPVTLYELITELKAAEKEERRRQRQRQSPRPPPDDLIRASDVVSVAHDEDYQVAAEMVMTCYDQLAPEGSSVTMRALCLSLGRRMIDVYIPLLFLMLDGKVEIWQEEYFGDVYVRRKENG
jgi:segregation and condensation protein A